MSEFVLRHQLVEEEGYLQECSHVRYKTLFIREGCMHARSTFYFADNGMVIAYQDCVEGRFGPLNMSRAFSWQYVGEPEYLAILNHAGTTTARVVLYDLER